MFVSFNERNESIVPLLQSVLQFFVESCIAMLAGSSLIRKIHSTHVAAHILLKDVSVNRLVLF